jgi:hypothetical protein
MSAVTEAIGGAFEAAGDAVGTVTDAAFNAADSVMTEVVQPVADAATQTIDNALANPVQTALQVGAIATGNAWLIPTMNAATSLANGASLEDVAKGALISTAGAYTGSELGMQFADQLDLSDAASKVAGSAISGATSAALRGGDPLQGAVSGAMYNSLGQLIKSDGSTKVSEAQPPAGVQLASADGQPEDDSGSVAFRMDMSGTPIFAEDSRADTVRSPYGYSLLPFDLAEEKPPGSYYDIAQNAWFMPNEDVQQLAESLRDGDYLGVVGKGASGLNDAAFTAYLTAINAGATEDEAFAFANRVGGAPGADGVSTLPEVVVTGSPDDPYYPEYNPDKSVGTLPEVVVTGSPDDPYYPEYNPDETAGTLPEVVVTDSPDDPFYPDTNVDQKDEIVDGGGGDESDKDGGTKPVIPKVPVVTPKPATPVNTYGGYTSPATSTDPSSKITTPSETWLGGMFRNTTSNLPALAAMGLLPEMQEAQALSALQRASGIDATSPSFFSYGQSVDPSRILGGIGSGQGYAQGGKIMASPLMAASGGDVPHKGSHYVQGAGGGQDDLIPAKLADGEYVFDAEIVAALGDGSNKEGAKKLDAMREAIRKHKRSGSTKTIPPKAKSPLQYFKEANK